MSLSGLSRADRLLGSIVLAAAAPVALVAWLVMPPEKTGGRAEQPSTFFNAAYGTKAAYLTLDRLEYPVTRLRRPIGPETLRGIGVLFILDPTDGLERHEMTELEAWVRQGHALVVVPGSSVRIATGRRPASTPGSTLADWFSVNRDSHHAEAGKPEPDEAEPGDSSDVAQPDPGVELDAGDPICEGIGHLAAGGDSRFAATPLRGPLAAAVPTILWRDKRGPMALRVSLGAGTIVALADAYPLCNRGIGQFDNGVLLGNMVRDLSRLSPGMVAFDEYHLGFPERDYSSVAMAKLMLGARGLGRGAGDAGSASWRGSSARCGSAVRAT